MYGRMKPPAASEVVWGDHFLLRIVTSENPVSSNRRAVQRPLTPPPTTQTFRWDVISAIQDNSGHVDELENFQNAPKVVECCVVDADDSGYRISQISFSSTLAPSSSPCEGGLFRIEYCYARIDWRNPYSCRISCWLADQKIPLRPQKETLD
eukprot:528132_1